MCKESSCCPGGGRGKVLAVVALVAVAVALRAARAAIRAWVLEVFRAGAWAALAVSAAVACWLVWRVVVFARAKPAARRNYWRVFLARHRWRHLTRNLGLARPDAHGRRKFRGIAAGPAVAIEQSRGHVRFPRARFRPDEFGITAAVRTIPGSGRAAFEKAAESIADEWQCQRVQVSQRKPGRLIVRGLVSDPLSRRFGPERAPAGTYEHPDPTRPYLGLSEWAEHRYLSLAGQTGIVIGGIPGRGKSSLIGSLLCQWAPSPAVQIAAADGKGSSDMEDWDPRMWMHCGDDLEDAVAMLEDAHALMRARLACVVQATGAKNSWHTGPSEAWPLVIVILDECQTYLDVASYKGDKEREALARRCVTLTAELIRKGRSAMMVTILATQKPTTDSIPSTCSANAGISLCFGVKTIEAAAAVLGPDIREYGSVSPVGLRDDSMVGVLTSTLPTGQDPFTRVRVPGFSEAEIASRAAASAHLRRDPRATLPGVGEGAPVGLLPVVPDTIAELVPHG
jgi:DNA segregation ATPase FtsK/SpoIIIE, S-DNA-T family